jgi:hypothetical protein
MDCTKQRGRLGRRAGLIAWMAAETAAMRSVQPTIRACLHFASSL